MFTYQSLGVDVAKHTLQTYDGHRQHVVSNQPAALRRWLHRLAPGTQIICEPSGGYERQLLTCAHQAGVSACLVNARQVRAFARGLGRLEKTDRLDAAVLRHYGVWVQPRPLRHCAPKRT